MSSHDDCGHDHSKDMNEEDLIEITSFLHEQFTKFPNEVLMGALQAAVTEIFIRCQNDEDFKKAWDAFNDLIEGAFIFKTKEHASYEMLVGERERLQTLRLAELDRRQMGPGFEEQAMGELHQLFETHGVVPEDGEEFRPGNYL